MSDTTYKDRVVKITDLVGPDGQLNDFVFVNCYITGPAVLMLLGNSVLANNNIQAPNADAVIWEVPPSRQWISGAIAAKDCTFDSCTLVNIGFAGPPDVMQKIRDAAA